MGESTETFQAIKIIDLKSEYLYSEYIQNILGIDEERHQSHSVGLLTNYAGANNNKNNKNDDRDKRTLSILLN